MDYLVKMLLVLCPVVERPQHADGTLAIMERPLSSLVLVHERGLAPTFSASGAGKLTVGPLLFAHPVTLDKVSVEKQRRLEPLSRDTFGAPISEPK